MIIKIQLKLETLSILDFAKQGIDSRCLEIYIFPSTHFDLQYVDEKCIHKNNLSGERNLSQIIILRNLSMDFLITSSALVIVAFLGTLFLTLSKKESESEEYYFNLVFAYFYSFKLVPPKIIRKTFFLGAIGAGISKLRK